MASFTTLHLCHVVIAVLQHAPFNGLTMNKQFLKRMVTAHSWLGLIISSLLFVVFFAGSITFFKEEINQWAFQPHFSLNPSNSQSQPLTVSKILAATMDAKPFNPQSLATLVTPSEHMPYYQLRAKFIAENNKTVQQTVMIDPYTGNIIGLFDQFYLAKFIYKLHYDLNLSLGSYIVGFITLFMFFALVSGVLIHARKLVGQFFRYQTKQDKRRKLLDMHNVIGVMTLPFTIMYAISGLLFNLLIIYQVVFVVVLYQGDREALVKDSGYPSVTAKWQDQPLKSTNIDALYNQIVERYQHKPESIRIYNYTDQSAVIHFRGEQKDGFGERYEVAYKLNSNELLFTKDSANHNAVARGLAVMAKLHFGNYAGFDLRLIYFLLGMGVCVLIVTGNLLWIEKQAKQRNPSLKSINLVTNFTLLSTAGVVLATAVAFMFERILPPNMLERADIMIYSFVVTLVISAIYITQDNNKNRCLRLLLKLAAIILVAVVFIDWIVMGSTIYDLWQQGVKSIVATQIGLLVVAALLTTASLKLDKKTVRATHFEKRFN
jgi:uncharacterized iron-regulated membrane protein